MMTHRQLCDQALAQKQTHKDRHMYKHKREEEHVKIVKIYLVYIQ